MKRRHFIAALAAWSVTARAQPRRRLVGMLDTSPRPLNANFDALVEGLARHGHVEGENFAFAYRSADGRNDRFPALARELVDLGVDVIVTRGTPAALAAKAATATKPIPVVMAAAGDPETIARNAAKPALNLTGFGAYAEGIEAKRVALLRDLLPKAERVAGADEPVEPVAPGGVARGRGGARRSGHRGAGARRAQCRRHRAGLRSGRRKGAPTASWSEATR